LIGKEPRNERERRAEDRAREQMEGPPSTNVQIIKFEDGRVMIRELDKDGNLIRETFGFMSGGKE
jgi:hypothetical protein